MNDAESDRAARKIIPKLPDYFRLEEGDKFPADLIESEIVGFGTINEAHVEGGGLVIDYKPRGSAQIQRLHLAFNELGMWIHRQSTLD
jgi:hypothetical protein